MKAKSKNPPNKNISNEFIFKDANPDDTRVDHYINKDVYDGLLKTALRIAEEEENVYLIKFLLELLEEQKPRTRLLNLNLPKINTIKDIDKAITALIDQMSRGEISPDEANSATEPIKFKRDIIVQRDLIDRVEKIEEANKKISDL